MHYWHYFLHAINAFMLKREETPLHQHQLQLLIIIKKKKKKRK